MQQKPLTDHTMSNPTEEKKKWYHYYFKVLLQGIIVSLPIAILIFLLFLGFKLVFNILSPISILLGPKNSEPHWSINILSLMVLLGFFFVVGWLVRNKAGKDYFRYVEDEYLSKVPLYSTVRDLVQQFSGIRKMPFSQVALVDIFNTGVWMTGFVTEEINRDMFTVFVPTAPNPTNGNIYHVPASRLQIVNIKSETAMRTVVGMGTGSACLFVTEEENKSKEAPPIHSIPKDSAVNGR